MFYKIKKNKLISLGKKYKETDDIIKQYHNYGFWLDKEFLPNMYLNTIEEDIPLAENKYFVKFRGLIAIGRVNRKKEIHQLL